MKVGLVHGTLSKMGGGEKVAIGFIEGMNELGIKPEVFTGDEILNGQIIYDLFGKKLDFNHTKISTVKLRSFMGLYRNTLPRLLATKMKNFDLIVDTSGLNVTPIFMPKKMIRYVHNPVMHRLRETERKGLFWKAYRYPYEIISQRLPKKCELLANSKFTSERIKEEWGRSATVVYPPVELMKPDLKELQMISVGRFSFEKRYEEIICLAASMPTMKFIICGALYDKVYFDKIALLADGMENVKLLTDVPNEELRKLLAKSTYFLHAMRNEDFGIAVVEAMSCGCIPIVHRSGGPMEIVGDESLTFNVINEVPTIIASLDEKKEEISKMMVQKASEYSYGNFVERVKLELKKALE